MSKVYYSLLCLNTIAVDLLSDFLIYSNLSSINLKIILQKRIVLVFLSLLQRSFIIVTKNIYKQKNVPMSIISTLHIHLKRKKRRVESFPHLSRSSTQSFKIKHVFSPPAISHRILKLGGTERPCPIFL